MGRDYEIETIKMLKLFREKNQDVLTCAYKAFIEPLRIGEISNGRVFLVSPLKGSAKYVMEKYQKTFKEIFTDILGRECEVLFMDYEDFLLRKKETYLQFVLPEPIEIKNPFISKFLGHECLLLMDTAISEKNGENYNRNFTVPKEYEYFFEQNTELELVKVFAQEPIYLICPQNSEQIRKLLIRFFLMGMECSSKGEVKVRTKD